MRFSSYILCCAPRSGSTLLCDLLASTDVAGKPHSYYRRADAAYWAELWGVPKPHRIGEPEFEKAYLSAMIRYGTGGTEIFGLRLMGASLAEAAARLGAVQGDEAGAATRFARAFGPPLYIRLSREDKLAQAVSLLRAEQTGLWHRNPDGTERERTGPPRAPRYDSERLSEILGELDAHDAVWLDFFADGKIDPVRLTYEKLAADPKAVLETVLAALGRDPDLSRRMRVQTAKLADPVSLEWADRRRKEMDAGP